MFKKIYIAAKNKEKLQTPKKQKDSYTLTHFRVIQYLEHHKFERI